MYLLEHLCVFFLLVDKTIISKLLGFVNSSFHLRMNLTTMLPIAKLVTSSPDRMRYGVAIANAMLFSPLFGWQEELYQNLLLLLTYDMT